MPPPVLVAPFGHLAVHLSRYVLVGLSDAAIALLLGRLAWRQLPLWIREDVSLQSFTTSSSAKDKNGELGTLASVIEKLQAVVALASQRIQVADCTTSEDGSTQKGIPFLHSSVLAYVQLLLQLRTLYPEQMQRIAAPRQSETTTTRRDATCSPTAPNTAAPLTMLLPAPFDDTTITDCLDFSVAAYETDTDHLQHVLNGTEDATTTDTENDDDVMWEILDHNSLLHDVRPGHSVGHYVAVDDTSKRLLVAVRGTASLEEVLTDCCGGATSFASYLSTAENDTTTALMEWTEVVAEQPTTVSVDAEGGVELTSGLEQIVTSSPSNVAESPYEYDVRCHEGILACAKRLADRIRSTVETYVVQRGYKLLLCGHSLGAGVASLTGLVLRSMVPSLLLDEPARRRLQVVAFAPPPVLDHDSAVAASSFTISIVNQCDLIPRLSLVNMTVFLEFLRSVSQRLQERSLAPQCTKSTMAFLRKLMQPLHAVQEKDLLLSLEEFNAAFDAAEQRVHLRDPDHLFVAGRVLLLLMEENSGGDSSNNIDMQQRLLVSSSTTDSRDDDALAPKLLRCLDTDGSTGMLRRLEVDLFRMISDHVTTTYYENLESVLGRRRR